MEIILTGPKGKLAYWSQDPVSKGEAAFGGRGQFQRDARCSFARLSAFGANSNHAPRGADGAITADIGMDLLFKIAGRR